MKAALRIEEVVAVKTAQVKALGGATIKTVTILTVDGSRLVITCVTVPNK